MMLTRAVNDFTVIHYSTNTTNLKLHRMISLLPKSTSSSIFNYEKIQQPQLRMELCNMKFWCVWKVILNQSHHKSDLKPKGQIVQMYPYCWMFSSQMELLFCQSTRVVRKHLRSAIASWFQVNTDGFMSVILFI